MDKKSKLPSYARWYCDACGEVLYKNDKDCFYCEQKKAIKNSKNQDSVTDKRRRKKYENYLHSRR